MDAWRPPQGPPSSRGDKHGLLPPSTLMMRKTAEEESNAPLYMVMMVERCLPNRFPIWRTQDQPESLTHP